MSILNEHIEFVNTQITLQEKLAVKFKAEPKRQRLHLNTADSYKQLLAKIVEADRLLDEAALDSPRKVSVKQSLALSPKDLEGLPEELLKELILSDADKAEFTISNLIEEVGGVISLDKLLIAYYKKTGDILKRSAMTSRLYRMAIKGMTFNVPGKKGYYSNVELSEKEVDTLFSLEGNQNSEPDSN